MPFVLAIIGVLALLAAVFSICGAYEAKDAKEYAMKAASPVWEQPEKLAQTVSEAVSKEFDKRFAPIKTTEVRLCNLGHKHDVEVEQEAPLLKAIRESAKGKR